jgi:hypothetical protein
LPCGAVVERWRYRMQESGVSWRGDTAWCSDEGGSKRVFNLGMCSDSGWSGWRGTICL